LDELGIAEVNSANSKNEFVFHFPSKKSSIQIKDKKKILGVLIEWRLSGKV